MGIVETFMIYVVIGIVVATAMWTAHCHTLSVPAVFDLITWAILWPFFAPLLFGQAVPVASPPMSDEQRHEVKDSRLHETQQRLVQAIGRLDSLAEGVIKPQLTQIDAMVHSLDVAEHRLQEMEELLHSREFDVAQVDAALHELRSKGYDDEEPRVRSLGARRRNIEQLQTMRDRTRDELARALVKLEEISSQVLLLRFADQPETKLASMLKEVAENVEGLATVVLEMSEL
jgi:chromosome segregation ATPase